MSPGTASDPSEELSDEIAAPQRSRRKGNRMRQLQLKAMAKINLGLDVLRRREDGYHDLRMIMQTVQVYDSIRMSATHAEGIRLRTNLAFLPADNGNLAYRAAQLLMEEFHPEGGVFIDLEKHIPVAAGLAGGSADAAAVLVGMNRLFRLGLTQEDLCRRGVLLGADVPYCVVRGTALAEGIGEKLTRLDPIPDCFIVLAKPDVRVSTKAVYTSLHLDRDTVHPDIDGQLEAIRKGDLEGLCSRCGNALESVTVPMHPVIARVRDTMREGGALAAMMSGSGPSVFGIFRERKEAEEVCTRLRAERDRMQVFVTRPFQPASGRTGSRG